MQRNKLSCLRLHTAHHVNLGALALGGGTAHSTLFQSTSEALPRDDMGSVTFCLLTCQETEA